MLFGKVLLSLPIPTLYDMIVLFCLFLVLNFAIITGLMLIMTQGLFSQRTEPKLDLSHKLLPRSPTMTFSSVSENVTPTLNTQCYPNTQH